MSRRRARCSSSSTSVEELAVVGEELVVGAPVALDQRVADEQLAGGLRVDPAVVDLALGDDRHAVQRDLLVRHHRRLVLLPVRLAVGALEQVLGERLDPLRLDLRVDPGPQPGRLDQLGGHHEARRLLEERRAGEDRELGAAGAQVLVLRAVRPSFRPMWESRPASSETWTRCSGRVRPR